MCPVACYEKDFALGALEGWEEGFEDAVACSEGEAVDVGGCEQAGGVGCPVVRVVEVLFGEY